jgi:predicted nucleic acid-binding protein
MSGELAAWDTNVLSRVAPGSPLARFVEARAAAREPIAIAAPAWSEVVNGAESARRRGRMTPWMDAAFRWQRTAIADGVVRVLPLDEPAARTLGILRGRASSNRSTSWAFDAAIAATCWVHGYAVVTRNRADFDELAELIAKHIGGEPLLVTGPPA